MADSTVTLFVRLAPETAQKLQDLLALNGYASKVELITNLIEFAHTQRIACDPEAREAIERLRATQALIAEIRATGTDA